MRKCVMAVLLAAFFSLSACGGYTVGETGQETASDRLEGERPFADGEGSTGFVPESGRSHRKRARARDPEEIKETEISVFAASSLHGVMEELVDVYGPSQPNVRVTVRTGGSGKLLKLIEEGSACDIFIPAEQKPMDRLELSGQVMEKSRMNLVSNQVVVVADSGAHTAVTGLSDIGRAESVALADGSVPMGMYSRTALMELGLLEYTDYPQAYSSAQIGEALGTVIREQESEKEALAAVLEGVCEVGMVYYTDVLGHEEELVILELVGSGLTGEIVYPAARVANDGADERRTRAADDFFCFLCSEEAGAIYEKYHFETCVR